MAELAAPFAVSFKAFSLICARAIATRRGVAGLYRMPVDGGPEQPVLECLKPGFWGYWTASDNGIYFADLAKGVGGDLFYMRLRDRAVEHLCFIEKPFAIADSAIALAPDGHSPLYTQIDQSGSDIMLMDTGRGRR